MPSDHNVLYCDIDVDHIFLQVNADPTKHTYRKFTTDKVHLTDKYLKKLEELLEKARVFEKVDNLEEEMFHYIRTGKGDLRDMIRRAKILFNKTTQLMHASENKLGQKHYQKKKSSSPMLDKAAHYAIEIKKRLRIESISEDSNE